MTAYWGRKWKSPGDCLLKFFSLLSQIFLQVHCLEDFTLGYNTPNSDRKQDLPLFPLQHHHQRCLFFFFKDVFLRIKYNSEKSTMVDFRKFLTRYFLKIFLKNSFDRSGVYRIFIVLTEHNQMEKILLFSEVILSNINVLIMKQLLQFH